MATLPNPNPILNDAVANYSYIVDPSLAPVNQSNTSTIARTQVNQPNVTSVKQVDRLYGDIGTTLSYTIIVTNTGNVAVTNLIVTDTIPNGTEFIPATLFVNDAPIAGNPQTGIAVGNINPGNKATITFKVMITTIPNPNPIPNSATGKYNFTLDPSLPDGESASTNTNIVNTQFNRATFDTNSGIQKQVNKAYAKVGDTLTYTIRLNNTGNITANNVVFSDTIPSGTTFSPGSVRINNVPNGGNPGAGINVGNLAPGVPTTIEFIVTVNTIPVPNPIPNNATVGFTYVVDPSLGTTGTGGGNSNTVNTQVNEAVIDNKNGGGLKKAVDKAIASVNDTLTYTITVSNTGNVTANNVIFSDTIPNGTTFISNSMAVNGTTIPGNPQTGVNIGSVGPGATTTIAFSVLIATTIPTPNPIPNNATVRYTFTTNPSIPNGESGSGNTNTVNTQITSAVIDNKVGGGFVKSVDKAYANIGDTLTYTLTLRNTGNTTANNVVLTDTIPLGTTFVSNSVRVNGAPNPGNPQTGVNIGSIGPNAAATIFFNVVVNQTIPSTNPIPNNGTVNYTYTANPSLPDGQKGSGNSNTVNTQVNSAIIDNKNGGGLVKSADVEYAAVGDTVTYTVSIMNTGNVTANNLIIKDTIPTGTTFVPGSVTINGAGQTGVNPQTGVNLGNVGPNQMVVMTFKVIVNTIPTTNPIPNEALASYTYTIDPSVPNGGSSNNTSNIVYVKVNSAIIDNGSGGLVKKVDRAYGDLGDTLTYTIDVKNTGNIAATDVALYDTIPAGTTFIPNSVTVGGVPQAGANPQTGISLNSIPPQTTISITFQVKVSSITIPAINPVPNNSIVTYTFNKCQ